MTDYSEKSSQDHEVTPKAKTFTIGALTSEKSKVDPPLLDASEASFRLNNALKSLEELAKLSTLADLNLDDYVPKKPNNSNLTNSDSNLDDDVPKKPNNTNLLKKFNSAYKLTEVSKRPGQRCAIMIEPLKRNAEVNIEHLGSPSKKIKKQVSGSKKKYNVISSEKAGPSTSKYEPSDKNAVKTHPNDTEFQNNYSFFVESSPSVSVSQFYTTNDHVYLSESSQDTLPSSQSLINESEMAEIHVKEKHASRELDLVRPSTSYAKKEHRTKDQKSTVKDPEKKINLYQSSIATAFYKPADSDLIKNGVNDRIVREKRTVNDKKAEKFKTFLKTRKEKLARQQNNETHELRASEHSDANQSTVTLSSDDEGSFHT